MANCSQLAHRLNLLHSLFNHVHDPDAQSELADQINQVLDQMTTQGCFGGTQRTLTGTASVCADPPYFKRKDNIPYTGHLFIADLLPNPGAVTWRLDQLTVGVATISQRTGVGEDSSGFFDSTSGDLDLSMPISVSTPFGSDNTQLILSTKARQSSPCLGTIAGVAATDPANKAGSVELVGSASVRILGVAATVFLHITGTLS
jgi:hypothetical protein